MDKKPGHIRQQGTEREGHVDAHYREVQGADIVGTRERELEEIRRDIARTRAEMAETMYVIRQRLSPEYLKQQAKDATVGRAKEAVDDARSQVKGIRQSAMETIRQNPVPAAMVALGLGWLIVEGKGSSTEYEASCYSPGYSRVDRFSGRSQGEYWEGNVTEQSMTSRAKLAAEEKAGQVSDMVEQAQDRVAHLSDEAKAKAEELRNEAKSKAEELRDETRAKAEELRVEVQQQAEYAKSRVGEYVHQNPLAAAAIALAAGAALGAMVPETPQEDALMGEQHDRLMSRVEERAHDTLEKAQHVVEKAAQEAKETAEEEAKRQDLMPKDQQEKRMDTER
jgi:ElaB/YqjD/DUF883 family membrane-anchored ribosome-binding protein